MDHHKTLYKNQCPRSPRHRNNINRKIQEDNRAKQRRDIYLNSRNLSLSPKRQITKDLVPVCEENKENINEQNANTTRSVKIIYNTTNPEKLKRQEAYVKRYIEWKEAKKNKINPPKKKPFVCGISNSKQTTTCSDLVPKGHHKGFHPPAGLKNTNLLKKVEVKDKGRQSVYILVPTPRKKQYSEKPNKVSTTKKALPTKSFDSKKLLNGSAALIKSDNKVKILNIIGSKTSADLKKGLLKKSPSTSTVKDAVGKIAKPSEKKKSQTNVVQRPVKEDLKPRALKMPQPPPLNTTSTKKPIGAAAKVKMLTQKNLENVKPIKNARLAQNLKAKKPLNHKKENVKGLKIDEERILKIIANEKMVVQTPIDFATLNPFSEFVTSTKVKEFSQGIKINGLSPIKLSPKRMHSNSSAKRNIFVKDSDENTLKAIKEGTLQNKNRFNFLRYSEAKNITDDGVTNNGDTERLAVTNGCDKTVVKELEDVVDKTPPKYGPEERPANYLSPFVSVARGKVGLKKEKEIRNSIYLRNVSQLHDLISEDNKQSSPNYSVEVKRTLEAVRYFRKQLHDEIDRLHKLCEIWEKYKEENLEKIQNANGEDMINVTIGQTRLLTSKKFMQFKSLIDRCEAGATGIGNMEYDGSEDTKPIMSVDLEGFWSMLGLQVENLDKRFENLSRWKANDWTDPEEVKPMKKNNLTKVKKSKAAPATKTKPSSALQQMLRKMQAEMRKNKNKKDDSNDIVVLTSSKPKHRRSTSSNNSTPMKSVDSSVSRRISVTVKDRKYFSPKPTVISFSSSNRRASLQRKSLQESPKLKDSVQKFNNDLNALQVSFGLRKSVLNENSRRMSSNPKSPEILIKNKENSHDLIDKNNKKIYVLAEENKKETLTPQLTHISPAPLGRKSILKTPGTAKSRLRNVIFNEKLRVRKFNFLINDSNGEESDEAHEDLAKCCEDDTLTNEKSPERTLTLRSRKVRLRPSCEIVIPKK